MAEQDTFTIAQMLYEHRPNIDFRKLTHDLHGALSAGLKCDVTWVKDEATTAAFELPGQRLVIDFREWRRNAIEACLVVATGPSCDDKSVTRPGAAMQAQLVRTIVKRIASRYPCNRQEWSDCAGFLTEDGLFDALDALTCNVPTAPWPRARRNQTLESIVGMPVVTRPETVFCPRGNTALAVRRIDVALTAHEAEARREELLTAANVANQALEAQVIEFTSIRSALYEEEGSTAPAARLSARFQDIGLTALTLPRGGANRVMEISLFVGLVGLLALIGPPGVAGIA